MKKILTVTFAVFLLTNLGFSQKEGNRIELPKRYKMVGMNMTPLLVQLIPFNRSNPSLAGPYSLNYKSFRGNNAFRFGLGAFITEDAVDDNGSANPHMNMRLGWERRKSFYERWAYSFGMDFYMSTGNFNLVSSTSNDLEEGSVGMGFVWGTEYFLNPKVSLLLETQFLVGFGFADAPTLVFIPPVALYLNFMVPKRKLFRRSIKP